MVGVWEGLNLGSIPNDHMPSQKDPKISIERWCSTILPFWQPPASIRPVTSFLCPDAQQKNIAPSLIWFATDPTIDQE